MEQLISIIVPIYKVELYLRRCLDSILAQTYQNLEIILVDDGSPDNCGIICDEYAAKDNRIKVIHKENGGLSDARNYGLDIARGQYIGFVDSDDWISPDMYAYLLQGLLKYDADIAVCEYYNVYNKKRIATRRDEDRVFEGGKILEALLGLKIGNYAWNKLYKKELWCDIRYPYGQNYEDVRTTYKLFQKCRRVVGLKDAKYFYFQNNFGIVQDRSIKNAISCVASRMERYDAIYDESINMHSFMLREIYQYTCSLRDKINKASLNEFRDEEKNLAYVCSFLENHLDEFYAEYQWGKLGKTAFKLICEPKHGNWVLSKKCTNLSEKKGALQNKATMKWLKKKKQGYEENKVLSKYYKYFDKLPLDNNLVLLESRGGEDFASNIFYIAKELSLRGKKICISVKQKYVNKIKCILQQGLIKNTQIVIKGSAEYYKAFASAKYLFNDMVYSDRILKKEGQIWVNTWHGTPLKCLEFDVANQRHELGGASREFMRSDYISVPSQYMIDKLISSSRINNLCKFTKVLYSGYPRNQVFFDLDTQVQIKRELGIEDKEIFVYMPTWRGTFLSHESVSGEYAINKILANLDKKLNDNQLIFVKLHNYMNNAIDFSIYSHIKPFPDIYESYAFLSIADCLITDYSSVFFDFANTGRKIILFAYDKEDYLKQRGLYISFDALPFPIVCTYDELAEELNLHKTYDDSNFIKTYCTYDCLNATQKLLDRIMLDERCCEEKELVTNGKKNVLLYDAKITYRNYKPIDLSGISSDILQKDNNINIFYGYRQWAIKQCPQYLQKLSDDVGLFTFTYAPLMNYFEKIYTRLFGHVPTTVIKREINREVYGKPFQEIRVIDANKFDPFIKIINKFSE